MDRRRSVSSTAIPRLRYGPKPVDFGHDALSTRDCVGNAGVHGGRRPAVPLGETPSGQDCCRDKQNAFAALVHERESIIFALSSPVSGSESAWPIISGSR